MTSIAYGGETPEIRPLGTESLVKPPTKKGSVFNKSGFISPIQQNVPPGTGGFYPVGNINGPVQGPTPGTAATQQFGPQSNLIGSQFNPTPSTRTQTAQQYTSGAQQQYAGLPSYSPQNVQGYDQSKTQGWLDLAAKSMAGGGGAPSFGYSGQTGGARDITMQQLQQMSGQTPDRAKLAADTYQLLLERSQPGHEQGIRALGRNAARLGRIGSGLTTNELTDYETQRERGLDQSRRQLATESAGLSLQDVIDRVNTARGVSDSFAGQDVSMGGLNLSAYNSGQGNEQRRFGNMLDLAQFQRGLGQDWEGSQVRERDYGTGIQDRNADLARSRFGDFAGYESQLSNEDYRGRNEMRGERDYQYGLSRDAQGDAIGAQNAQQNWLDRLFDRGATMTDAGYRGSPADMYGQRADQYGGQAADAFSTWGPALAAYGSRQKPAATRPPQYGTDPNDWQNVV